MYQKTKPRKAAAGFTLVEILVIAPIVILAIGAFVALIITITGDVLRTKGSADLVYTTQDTLDRIEQDAVRAVEFRATSYTPQSPNGMGASTTDFDGGNAFTIGGSSPARLIIRSPTTNTQPLSSSRQLVFKNSPDCTDPTVPYTVDIIYFVKNSSLWRRILVGTTASAGASCTAPWQTATCSPGYTSTVCKAEDTELVTNLTSATVEYFDETGTTIPSASSTAVAVKVTLQTANTVAGRDSTNTSSLFVRRGNVPVVE